MTRIIPQKRCLLVLTGIALTSLMAVPLNASAAPKSSLLGLVEDVARRLEDRAEEGGLSGSLRLELRGTSGIDDSQLKRFLARRLNARLARGKVLIPTRSKSYQVAADLAVSIRRHQVWVAGTIEGIGGDGPLPLALSIPLDTDLELALGVYAQRSPALRWRFQKMGHVPPGVLDMLWLASDDVTGGRFALLHRDGVRLFRYDEQSEGGIVQLAHHALPSGNRWPRVAAGWMARIDADHLWVAASSGLGHRLNLKTGQFSVYAPGELPLRQSEETNEKPYIVAQMEAGKATVRGPFRHLGRGRKQLSETPVRVRDLLRWPGEPVWLSVTRWGQLEGRTIGKPPIPLLRERVGDRLALADLDGDGKPELLATAATAPGRADQLAIYRFPSSWQAPKLAWRRPLGEGSIRAMAIGQQADAAAPALFLVEQSSSDQSTVWLVEAVR